MSNRFWQTQSIYPIITDRFHHGAASNWTYQLQRRDALDDSSAWANVGVAVAGSDEILVFTDAATNSTRFDRIRAQ